MPSEGQKREGTLDLMAKQRRWKRQIVLVNRHEFREWFGVRSADKWGSFVDCNLSAIVHSYADWAGYPRGKHTKLEGRETGIKAAVVSSDGYHLFTASKNSSITVWNLTENREIAAWIAHDSSVMCLDYHSSGVLVSGSGDKSVRIWDACTTALIHILEGHKARINAVAFTEDGNQVVSGSLFQLIRLWSVETGECLKSFSKYIHSITSLRFIGEIMISATYNGLAKLTRLSDSEAYKLFGEEDSTIVDICVNCDQSMLALVYEFDQMVYSWPSMDLVSVMDAFSGRACFHPCKPSVMALSHFEEEDIHDGMDKDQVRICDVSSGEDSLIPLDHEFSTISDLCFTPCGTRLICVCQNHNIHVLDVSSI